MMDHAKDRPLVVADAGQVQIGIALPTQGSGASPAGIIAAAATAQDLGWSSAWTSDHILVSRADAVRHGFIFEALTTLAWVGSRFEQLRLGTSVLVVPLRNAVVLAKELATLDVLCGGRVVAGVGVGWNQPEFGNLGVGDRFHLRGAYLDETIRLWRHLWSGSREPFDGRFHPLSEYAFAPLPVHAERMPIVVGGTSAAAVRRAARFGDEYQITQSAPAALEARLDLLRRESSAAGRPMPRLSARVVVRFDAPATEQAGLDGDAEAMRRTLAAWQRLGVAEVVLNFSETDAGGLETAMRRFSREVLRA